MLTIWTRIKQLLKPLLYLLGATAILTVLCVATFKYFLLPDKGIFLSENFNRKLWQEDLMANRLDNPKDCQRGRMAQNVIDTILHSKLTKSEIIHMLGEPNKTTPDIFIYDIGWCSYIDPNTLDIEFMDNGQASAAYIVNH